VKPSFAQHLPRLQLEQWGILDVLLSHRSPIDLQRLAIADADDAYHFVLNYGYNLHHPDDAEEIDRIRNEAYDFIERHFLSVSDPQHRPLPPQLPAAIREANVVNLLMLASGNARTSLQRWACAILRVMHTIAHVSSDLSANFFPPIVEQILSHYSEHIYSNAQGQIMLGRDPDFQLPLIDFHLKAGKDRNSAIMKLLHKAENVAADIFDHIGVRFVTQDRLDALLVIKYLREKHLVTFPNVKSSRSVNTLIDIEKFKREFKRLNRQYEQGALQLDEFEYDLRAQAQALANTTLRRNSSPHHNPHTSQEYQSIQFTVRQLVRIPNPLYAYREYLDLDRITHSEQRRQVNQVRPAYSFFFPYEVQIVDEQTYLNNMQGKANHEAYKHKQLLTARQRVLGRLLRKVND
jgi:uncharacterized protein (TIGR04562 family)